MVSKAKPFGIIAIAVWAAFSGIIFLPTGFLLFIAGQADGSKGLFFTGVGILFSALGVVALACVYGLWSLQEWGRKTMLWYSLVSIPFGIISIFPIWPEQQMTTGNTVLQLVGIAINAVIVAYLSLPHVKVIFISHAE